MSSDDDRKRVTLHDVRRWVAAGQRFPMLSCYDATTASWVWQGGIDFLLVGDTAARFILGHDSTLPAPVPFMMELTAAVRRGAPNALIMADMPFGSYQCGQDDAMRHAASFLTDGAADMVKIEVDTSFEPLVRRMSSAGIPVVAHLGSRPQHKRLLGPSSRVIYRSDKQVAETIETSRCMVESGAVMLLLEAVPDEVSAGVVDAVSAAGPGRTAVPVIGCGAGPSCHGHVVVLHDLLGLTDWQPPFAPPLADLGAQIRQAASDWGDQVRGGRYLRDDHPYKVGS